MNNRMQKVAPLFVTVAAVLWGALVIFIKKFNQAGFSTMDIITIRAYGSVLFLFPGMFFAKRQLLFVRKKDLWCFVGTGVFSIVFFTYCYFRNLQESSVAFSAVLLYTAPVWVTLLSAVFFREKITKRKCMAMALALVGCILVSDLFGSTASLSYKGVLLGLGSGIGYGLYTIFGRFALDKGYHPLTVSAYSFLFACLGVLPFTNPFSLAYKLSENGSMLVLGLAMALLTGCLSYTFYTVSLQYLEAGRAAVLATLEPVVTTLIGIAFFQERITIGMGTGIVLVLAASVLVSAPKDKEKSN